MLLQDPPGSWSRRGALPKGGIAVTSLKGAGRGVLQAREGFSPLGGGGVIYACHTAWMTRRYTIHQRSLQTLLPQLNLAKHKVQNRKRPDHICHVTTAQRGRDEERAKRARQRYLCPNQPVSSEQTSIQNTASLTCSQVRDFLSVPCCYPAEILVTFQPRVPQVTHLCAGRCRKRRRAHSEAGEWNEI